MKRPTQGRLSGLVVGGGCALLLLSATPAFAAGLSVGSVELQVGTQPFATAQQVITSDVRGNFPKIAMPVALVPYVLTVTIQGMSDALAGTCDGTGSGHWSCPGGLEPSGRITILYRTSGTIVPAGRYAVTVSMGDNGTTYSGTGTVTVIDPPVPTVPANPVPGPPPSSGHSGASAPNPPTSRSPVPTAATGVPPTNPPTSSPLVADPGPSGVPAVVNPPRPGSPDHRLWPAMIAAAAVGLALLLGAGTLIWQRRRRNVHATFRRRPVPE